MPGPRQVVAAHAGRFPSRTKARRAASAPPPPSVAPPSSGTDALPRPGGGAHPSPTAGRPSDSTTRRAAGPGRAGHIRGPPLTPIIQFPKAPSTRARGRARVWRLKDRLERGGPRIAASESQWSPTPHSRTGARARAHTHNPKPAHGARCRALAALAAAAAAALRRLLNRVERERRRLTGSADPPPSRRQGRGGCRNGRDAGGAVKRKCGPRSFMAAGSGAGISPAPREPVPPRPGPSQ